MAIRSSKNGLPRNVEMPSDTGERSQAFWPLEGAPGGSWHRPWEQDQGAMRLLGGSGIVGNLGSFRASGVSRDRSESVLRSRCHADNA